MIPALKQSATQGGARPARGGREAPAPWGGGTGAARFAGKTDEKAFGVVRAVGALSGAQRDAGIPQNWSGLSHDGARARFEYFRQDEGAGR